MSGVYSLNDPGYSLRHPSGPKTFRTDKDGNFPSGIPGTPGSPYIRPGGIWTGEQDWDEIVPASFSHDLQGADGNGTDGLIGENGVVYADLPPNSRSYILGPLVDGFVVNHVYDAYTRIGYIQKDTRQFVLLAKIFGTWKEGFVLETGAYRYESGTYNYPVWDGTTVHASTGFHTYGSFTLADAQWMRAQILEGKYVKNVAYRNSGGIQQTWMQYYGALTGLGIFYNGVGVGAGSGDAVDGDGGGGGYGQGGDPTIGTQQTDPPKKGDAEDAGFPWFPFGALGDKVKDLWDDITDGLGDIKDNLENFFNDAFDDAVQGAKDFRDSLQSSLEDVKAGLDAKSDWSVQDWLDSAGWYTVGGGASQEVNDFLNTHFQDSLGQDAVIWEFKDTIGDTINNVDKWIDENITDIGGTKDDIFNNIVNTVTETVGEMTHDTLNLQSAANFLSQFNQNAALPKDQQATSDNPIDLTDSLATNDLNS